MWKPSYQPELYHHGVKGMKWGVRRDTQKSYLRRTKRDLYLLNDRDYNQKVRKLKNRRDFGSINDEQYRSAKKEAKIKRKETSKNIKSMKAAKSLSDARKQFTETRTRAVKEIPHYRLKRGARTVSTLLSGLGAVSLAATAGAVGVGAAMLGTSYGASMGAAYAVSAVPSLGAVAGMRGVDHVIRKKINQAVT